MLRTVCVKCGKPASVGNGTTIHVDVKPNDWPIGHVAVAPIAVQLAASKSFVPKPLNY